ncbi:hypothetical protein M431DRAFT_479135 [Trichoderma harzianum CBS 226.95]|uniref:Uncharacterized protein n=1 Tax=Trichoderma harzianum CBS 226.95 TaxID=983964 RepID=A0A2T4AKF0_TRIHA|nr:hypothetical protein M431DRAFT_479135 [Trichoderma harzianum CBS 226.95]PTB57536.1 hypothetical protein M431DRAFT_479135 [Trichoderma harzianum CBS 226.95]
MTLGYSRPIRHSSFYSSSFHRQQSSSAASIIVLFIVNSFSSCISRAFLHRHQRFATASLVMALITALDLVVEKTWTVLCDTPTYQQNPNFMRFLLSMSHTCEMAKEAQVSFAPGLFHVMMSPTPPDISFFKNLPIDVENRWGIYVVTLERPGYKPRIHIGSRTSQDRGVKNRFHQYDIEYLLPFYVTKAVQERYEIASKGLLCWTPIIELLLGFYSWLLRELDRPYRTLRSSKHTWENTGI